MSGYTIMIEKENAELRKERDELLSIFNAKFENDESLSIDVIFDKLGEMMPDCALADYLKKRLMNFQKLSKSVTS
jgi:hypothetical protein